MNSDPTHINDRNIRAVVLEMGKACLITSPALKPEAEISNDEHEGT
jgi:hypothetical protein